MFKTHHLICRYCRNKIQQNSLQYQIILHRTLNPTRFNASYVCRCFFIVDRKGFEPVINATVLHIFKVLVYWLFMSSSSLDGSVSNTLASTNSATYQYLKARLYAINYG